MSSSTQETDSQLIERFAHSRDRAGSRAIEQFLVENPQACSNPETAVRIIYEDFCLRQEAGEQVDPQVLLDRFPQWSTHLQIVFDFHQLVRETSLPPCFPVVGEQFGDFCILSELGRGAQGRVYLATQPSLSDRPVVIKVTPRTGNEHLSLARLQHSAIVPLYLVQDDAARNLRLLCMPYVGGISLADMLHSLAMIPIEDRSGRHFSQAIKKSNSQAAVVLPFEGPALKFLTCASYVQVVCWIGACLADALNYAHGRGLLHLDIKPSNVLLAGDGQPMLLDFHLAHEVIQSQEAKTDRIGGTPAYMSPEQKCALEAVRNGKTVPVELDGRSDTYSLGMVLYELLAGTIPADAEVGCQTKLPRLPPHVPPPVARTIQRCLASDPNQRYSDSGVLAAELRSYLRALPDGGAVQEKAGREWNADRHQPGWLATSALALLVGALLGSGGIRYLTRIDRSIGLSGDRQGAVPIQIPSRRTQMAADLHNFVDRVRFLDCEEVLASEKLRQLDVGCKTAWGGRRSLLKSPGAQSDRGMEQQIRTDLLDLAIFWANLHVRGASESGRKAAQRDALDVLTQAQNELGGGPVLDREKRAYLDTVVDANHPLAFSDDGQRTAWEFYALGCTLLRTGQWESASASFQQAVDLDSQAFWPNYYRGVCASRLGHFEDAVAAFSACVTLTPQQPKCFYHRALAYRALGCVDSAARDFSIAQKLDPTLEPPPASLYSLDRRFGER